MYGRVTPDYTAMLTMEVLSQEQQRHRVQAMIDTGFNGHLTLPTKLIDRLGLPSAGHRRATLGDGRVVVFQVYLATVWWYDRAREILALQSDGGPLVGMGLLAGSRVTFDVVADGFVDIERLPDSKQA